MLIMAGFNLHNESWISHYLNNPDFTEYNDFHIKKAIERNSTFQTIHNDQENANTEQENLINTKTDQELNDILDKDEYFFERYHVKSKIRRNSNIESVNSYQLILRNIHSVIKYYYRNPLSLKEIARIKIRHEMLKSGYKLKLRINSQVNLPKCLKSYLLLSEYTYK